MGGAFMWRVKSEECEKDWTEHTALWHVCDQNEGRGGAISYFDILKPVGVKVHNPWTEWCAKSLVVEFVYYLMEDRGIKSSAYVNESHPDMSVWLYKVQLRLQHL